MLSKTPKSARTIGTVVGAIAGVAAFVLATVTYAVTGGFYAMCNPAWSPECELEGTTYGLTLDIRAVDFAIGLAVGVLAYLISTLMLGAWQRGRRR